MQSVVGSGATVLERSGIVTEHDLLKEALLIRREDGVDAKAQFVAYPVQGGYQMMILIHAASIPDTDPRVDAALEHIATLWKSGFRLTSMAQLPSVGAGTASSAPPPASAPQPDAGSQAVGENCRREPVWGQRISAFCYPTGICSGRVIKDYETVCD